MKTGIARWFRVASLFVAPAIAMLVIGAAGASALHVAGGALAVVWFVMFAVVMFRVAYDRDPDLLTATGCSVIWTGTAAIVAAAESGWASLSVLGVFGVVTTCLAVTWTAIVARESLWRRATVERSIRPEVAIEGDVLREEIRLRHMNIPIGMRLFVTGRATPDSAISRYVVGSSGSGAEVKLESELDLARRGDHRVPPLALRIGDVLGLTCTPFAYRGETRFTVLPRTCGVDGVRALLGNGGDATTSCPERRLPTEGTFRIREYAPGDDARRIHWIRSLQANQLVVRLPDEIPPAEPEVRVILDSYFEQVDALQGRAPAELLDALVRVWLGIAKSLSDTGSRVTLVTGAAKHDATAIVPIARPIVAGSSREAARLGSRVAWQAALPVPALLVGTAARQVVVSSRPQPAPHASSVVWVVVPEAAWTTPEAPPNTLAPALAILAFPSGSSENRRPRRVAESRRVIAAWNHRVRFSQLVNSIDWRALPGAYVARPNHGRVALEVVR